MNMVIASPYPYELPPRESGARVALVIIDMQRDFIESGGFGAALGNQVEPLQKIVPTVAGLLRTFRALRLPVIHSREGHRPDLSDCPPAKRSRGDSSLRIGDPGPMGRILVLGEPGNDFVKELRPESDELVIDKPGKGAFYATNLHERLQEQLARSNVDLADRLLQRVLRRIQIVPLSSQEAKTLRFLLVLFDGQWIHRSQRIQLLADQSRFGAKCLVIHLE